jgi:elongator complex protein 3
MAKEAGYKRISVISAIGTREYYAMHGYEMDGLYMTRRL